MTYYDILGVATTASKDEIRKAYLHLVQQFHPDKSPNVSPAVKKLVEEKFKDIQEAYEILSKHRAEYDVQLRAVAPPPVNPPPPQKAAPPPPSSAQKPARPATPSAHPTTKWTARQWTQRLGAVIVAFIVIWMNASDQKLSTSKAPYTPVNIPTTPPVTDWQKKRDQLTDESTAKVPLIPATTPFAEWQKKRYQATDAPVVPERSAPPVVMKTRTATKSESPDVARQQEAVNEVSTETTIASKTWKLVGSKSPTHVRVWIKGDHLYEFIDSVSSQSVYSTISCDTTRGVSVINGPAGLYAGACIYTIKWLKNPTDVTMTTCQVAATEIITVVSATRIEGWSQHIDYSPWHKVPATCPIAEADGKEFAMEDAGTNDPIGKANAVPLSPTDPQRICIKDTAFCTDVKKNKN